MASETTVRQKIQQARSAYIKGQYAKARSLLKGVNHPKADVLRTQIDEVLPPTKGFPVLPFVGFLGVIVLALFGMMSLLVLFEEAPEALPLPTLIPTSDCTQDMVTAWWMAQEIELSRFVMDASSASRTMQGERLDGHIATLQEIRDGMETPPECISASKLAGYGEVLGAMDATLEEIGRAHV